MNLDWYPHGSSVDPSALRVLWQYQSTGYWQTNQRLRDGQPPTREAVAIDHLLALLPPTPTALTVYRGIGPYETADRDHGKSSFVDSGFLSTSLDYDTALAFAQRGGAIYEINVPTGYPALWLGGLAAVGADIDGYEDEILLPRGTRIHIHEADMVWTEDTGLIDRYTCSINLSSLNSRHLRRTSRGTGPR